MVDIAIKVENISKTFKLPHEKQNSIKSLFVNLFRSKKTYERQQVLKNVSFEVKEGDFFAIVGRNGSGKSTLLKMIAGIYEPNKGNIQVNGKLTPFIELGVGFNPNLTGRENVFLNGALLGFNRKEINAMYQDIVDFAEIERFMDQKLKNYSSGMQVRLAFSIAIRARSDILLLDEVLAVGDAAFQQKCYNYFEELKEQKKTVVFVSHDMAAIKRFCTKAIYIKEGKLIDEGSPLDIADLYAQENIDTPVEPKEDGKQSQTYKVSVRLAEQNEKKAVFNIAYSSKNRDEMYVGISVMKDGAAIAELSTSLERPLIGEGEVTYSLDTGIFNAGTYFMDAALFKLKNRELLAAVYQQKAQFVIKGHDITKGGAMKLDATWGYGRKQ